MVCSERPPLGRRPLGLLLAGALLALAGCGKPREVSVTVPAGAPPPQKIGRLLVWLPENQQFMDPAALSEAFRVGFAPYDVPVEVGFSKPLELDKREAQRQVIARFRPTHLIDFSLTVSTAQYRGMYDASLALVGALVDRNGRTLRILGIPVSGPVSRSLIGANVVDQLARKLQAEGYL